MANLTLGSVEFNLDELPEEINFGGTQAIALRQFPGGGIDIQPMGAFDDPIAWQGTFIYTDALQRCIQVGMMRIKAAPVKLTLGQISRMVLVTKFVYHYQNDFNIPYEIECQPVIAYGAQASVNGIASSQSSTIQTASTASTSTNTTTATTKSGKKVYVAAKDTLWALAVKYYGDGSKWPTIAQANGIKNAKTLAIGTLLTIPDEGVG
jgi:LysM repeat protein